MTAHTKISGIAKGLAVLLFAALHASSAHAGASTPSLSGSKSQGAPQISGTPPTSVVAGNLYDFTPVASDPNGDPLKFSISKLPKWAKFDTSTGRLSGTPVASDVGRIGGIVISVSDGTSTASLPKFTLTVLRGSAPTISGTPATSDVEGNAYAFQPVASDADGQPLTFSIVAKPTWASFNSATGMLSGTPGPGSAGSYANIVISVTDGASVVSLPAFTITVKSSKNTPPTISGSPALTATEGQGYSFQPSASDADGDALKFSIVNPPSWAAFSASTGRLSGTPPTGSAGTYASIVISVSDGIDVSFLPMFSITVAAATTNHPPTISGVPPTSATAGQPYAFMPSASDPDGQTLSFSIANKPVWASFDPATGALSGTPSDTQVGTYSGITISVSDGTATVSLPAFTVTVAAAPTGWATLNWVPPTQNVDGTPLTDLAGYRIRYGQAADALTSTLDVPGPAMTSATIESLPAGTWYFAVKAYTAANVESDLSNVASKTIN